MPVILVAIELAQHHETTLFECSVLIAFCHQWHVMRVQPWHQVDVKACALAAGKLLLHSHFKVCVIMYCYFCLSRASSFFSFLFLATLAHVFSPMSGPTCASVSKADHYYIDAVCTCAECACHDAAHPAFSFWCFIPVAETGQVHSSFDAWVFAGHTWQRHHQQQLSATVASSVFELHFNKKRIET